MSFEDDRLPKVEPPYLPPKEKNEKKYTLALDLDETLIHYNEGENGGTNNSGENQINEEWCFFVRPGLD